MKPFFVTIILLITLFRASVEAALDLGDAQGFNATVFGDFQADSADTEGRLAIEGNAIFPSSYSIGVSFVGFQNPQSSGTRDDVVVGGNATLNGNVSVHYGNARVGGTVTNGPFDHVGPNATTSSLGDVSSYFDFNAVESLIRSYSQSWASLADNGTLEEESWKLTLSGTNPNLNVFHVTAAQWNRGSLYIDTPQDSTVIINISGNTVTRGSGTMFFGVEGSPANDASLYRGNVLFNAYEATSVDTTSFQWEGNLFAPDALLTTGGGAINGQSFLGSVDQQGGFEFHNYFLTSEYAVIPEVSSLLMSVICLVTLGIFRHCRSR
jgi:choice-of-anchor A domain-containing protein